ncbi:fumarylacetoacetate hydrolase family protein [Muricoccus radiodurans]|uniref:fumarylacetoacetate hydrolase family protein n=1 Tax=Muricoccus radiodurans TaxID=2231721 RepID=UPI003CEF23F3
MRIVSYRSPEGPSFGLVIGDGVVDLRRRLGGRFDSLRAVLEAGALPELAAHEDATPDHALAGLDLLPAVPNPGKILCVGLNYRSHVGEAAGREVPEFPRLFSRFTDTLVAHGQPMVRPRVSTHFDYEGELAVIIGRGGRHIPVERAMEHVAGYAVFNDGSMRDYQKHMITAGKNFWRSGPLGPWVVTADAIPDPTALTLETRVNGEVRQHASTGELIYPIPVLIEYASRITPLSPGDVLATGTPEGVASHRKPPIWLKAGDVVEVEISGIGLLRNPVVDEETA